MKRATQIHLAVARENLTALCHPSERRAMAAKLWANRVWFGKREARRIYRLMYGPLEID